MNQFSLRIGRRLALLVGVGLVFLGAVPGAQAADKIFWANFSAGAVGMANLDGSGGAHFNPGTADTTQLSGTAADPATNRLYWGNGLNDEFINFANLDNTGGGGNLSTSSATAAVIRGLVVDHAAGRMYWANESANKISWANLDGSGGGDLDTTGATVSGPSGVALDKSTGRIYWANGGSNAHPISSASLSGGSGADLDTTGATASGARGVSIDTATGKVYWSNFGNNTISFANLAGGGGGQLSTTGATVDQPHGLAIDKAAGKVYWTNFNANTISSANLDGSGGGSDLNVSGAVISSPLFPSLLKAPHNLTAPDISGASSPGRALPGDTLDCSDGTWAADDTGALMYRAPRTLSYQWLRDGSPIGGETNSQFDVHFADIGHQLTCQVSASNAAGSADSPESAAVTVDPIRAERVFWANDQTHSLSYANLDGSGDGANVDTTGVAVTNPGAVSIDSAAGKLYWSEPTNGAFINYANLDNTGAASHLNTGAAPIDSNVEGLAVDPVGGRVYWGGGGQIGYANLDGSGGGALTTTGATVDGPVGFAIDRSAGRLYWTNANNDTHPISYANLDGSGGGGNLDTTGATAHVAWGLAISGGKVYWANLANSTISYANLSGGGGGQLPIAVPVSSPQGVAIDADAGKIYWANSGGPTISYADLNGSNGGTLDTSGTGIAPSGSPGFPALLKKPKDALPPSVTGLQSAGHTITCNKGSWPDDLGAQLYRAPESYDYQWLKDDVPISGETNSTYSVQAGDTGHVFKCRVTATNLGGITNATSAGATIQVPPANTGLPTITGNPAPAKTLTCHDGTWSGDGPQAKSYRWLRNGTAIAGATSTSYLVKAADAGKQVKCRVTASNNGGSAMADSAAVTIKTPPKNTVAPKITGTPTVGKTLTCAKGTWTGTAPITYKYQWLRQGSPIAGATSSTYVAKGVDKNKFLSCKVTATNAAGSASKTSAAVKVT